MTSAPVPVAVTKNVPKMYDIHTDHLNTPRVIADNTETEVWRWDSAPFGEMLPNEQPQNNASKFVWNQRFPGQYYDEETGFHYNYFKDYDSQSGRYVQSDPIDLKGGINVFAYVTGNPVGYMDPFGLVKKGAVEKEVVENVQDFVNTVTQKALTPEQIISLTDKVISEVSVFQVPSLLGLINGMPVELTKNQVETIKKIIKNLGENFPDDPAVKVIVDRFPKMIKDPKYCLVK
ncbi:RHS repeat domain-containing protein [Undibacterium sp. Ji83W]|uniref:RHS repeat domain-containing protein n=1 Tax=Undibacterium sp. Ji83W TaxID=3413043 RepID=UPI003BF16072